MFGPHRRRVTNKVHYVLKRKNPETGEFVEHYVKFLPSVSSDKLVWQINPVCTVILKPDNELRILVDREEKKKVNFLSAEDFYPVLIPAKTTHDSDDKKPTN